MEKKTASKKKKPALQQPLVKRRKNYPLRKWQSYKRFIIVCSEDRQPMSWSERDKQLVYCTTEWQDTPMPLRIYSRKRAEKHIEQTIINRRKWNMNEGKYLLMPVG